MRFPSASEPVTGWLVSMYASHRGVRKDGAQNMTKRSTQNTDLSAERLRSFLQYNKDTGNFYWLVNRRVKAGDIAGTPNYSGHIRIRIDGTKYMAHQLAWLYVYGEFPMSDLDHINGDPRDNRISNLRKVTHAENMQNQRKAHRSKKNSTLMGAFKSTRCDRWHSAIRVGNKRDHLGSFATDQEAHEAYIKAKSMYHPFAAIE